MPITYRSSGNIGDTVIGGTEGSVLFVGVGGLLAQDNPNFFWDDSNNRLGIGTTNPDSLLHLDNGTSDTELILEKDTGTNSRIIFHNVGVALANITFDTIGDLTIENDVSDADIIFKINDGGVDTEMMRIEGSTSFLGIGTATPADFIHVNGAGSPGIRIQDTTNDVTVRFIATDTFGAQGTSSNHDFRLLTNNSTVILLKAAGLVGVGTEIPDGILHIDNGTSNTDFIIEKDSGTLGAIRFHNAGTELANITHGTSGNITVENDLNNADIIFKINDGGVDTEMMRIDGSVSAIGIGTATPTSTLDVDGSLSMAVSSQTGTYTALASDHVILCGSGNETFTVTLPAASGITGRIYHIKNIGTGTITVDGNSSETIDGGLTAVISNQFESITISCDGSNWHIL